MQSYIVLDFETQQRNNSGKRMGQYTCHCGKKFAAVISAVKNGYTKSCGCSRSSGTFVKHRMSNTKIYNTWQAMKRRCLDKKFSKYSAYGARGIKICDEWLSFEGFYCSMGASYFEGATIDRIDNDGNYEPNNCQWLSVEENSRKSALHRSRDQYGVFI